MTSTRYLDEMTRDRAEKALGRSLTEADAGRFKTLNDIDGELLAALRKLNHPAILRNFARFIVDPASSPYVDGFLKDVILGGQDPAEWLKGRLVVPSFSLQDQLTLDRSELLIPLGGTFDRCLPPKKSHWRSRVGWVGAPCLVDPDSDYFTLSQKPPHSENLLIAPTVPVTSQTVALRRWHAARLSSILEAEGRLLELRNNAFVPVAGLTRPDALSPDAAAAVAALRREVQSGYEQAEDRIFGFFGPDAWYSE